MCLVSAHRAARASAHRATGMATACPTSAGFLHNGATSRWNDIRKQDTGLIPTKNTGRNAYQLLAFSYQPERPHCGHFRGENTRWIIISMFFKLYPQRDVLQQNAMWHQGTNDVQKHTNGVIERERLKAKHSRYDVRDLEGLVGIKHALLLPAAELES